MKWIFEQKILIIFLAILSLGKPCLHCFGFSLLSFRFCHLLVSFTHCVSYFSSFVLLLPRICSLQCPRWKMYKIVINVNITMFCVCVFFLAMPMEREVHPQPEIIPNRGLISYMNKGACDFWMKQNNPNFLNNTLNPKYWSD